MITYISMRRDKKNYARSPKSGNFMEFSRHSSGLPLIRIAIAMVIKRSKKRSLYEGIKGSFSMKLTCIIPS
jgi:hypothetical protein